MPSYYKNIQLSDIYNYDICSLKKEITTFSDIYKKYNNKLLELNNIKKYSEYILANTKVGQNIMSSRVNNNETNNITHNKINKKDNLLNKMNYQINDLLNDINIKKDMILHEEREIQNKKQLIEEEKKIYYTLKMRKIKL
ncbi:hypothetical protein PFDG_04993 [Plasmodium falciparum Dd2]|uniref:Uncharacterized protein n=1 Tax=Plasmodium falciparum (isolate Dd2) TaxID=57267 RepID=A0A0L7MA34_PLAF4|nr:hypothetical protein PFDG_04993 [Plasmodium falciparum Dd2]